jgi:hypothetical protein
MAGLLTVIADVNDTSTSTFALAIEEAETIFIVSARGERSTTGSRIVASTRL